MVKVCHMTSAHSSFDTRIFHKECVSLAAAGYEVYLVAPGESREERGVKVVGVGPKPASRIKRMTVFTRQVYAKALSLNCDIYHLHDPELLPAGIALKKQGKKVIFDSHESYPDQIRCKTYLPVLLTNIVSSLYYNYETYCVRRFDAVVVPCTFKGKNIFENRARVTVFVNNYPMIHEFEEELLKNANKSNKGVCYAGGLTHARGITNLIKAVFLADAKLYLAGTFSPDCYRSELEALSEYECVEYLGELNRTQLVHLYSKSNIGLSTLLNVGQYDLIDNLPTKVYEYMACGLPVIVSTGDYAASIIEANGCGVCVDPNNPEEIARAIRSILDMGSDAQALGEAGRTLVLKEFNWEVESMKLLHLYSSLLIS